MSREELADAVNAWIYARTGRVLVLTANYVGKMERGVLRWPNAHYRAGLRAVLGVARDRELGFRRVSRARHSLDAVDRKQFLTAVLGVGAGAAISVHPLIELVSTPIQAAPVPSVVGRKEINDVLAADKLFDSWDNAYGGGIARQAVTTQLRQFAELLQARCPGSLRPELFSAVGQVGHTAAFMAFDAYAHEDARRLYRFALGCAEHVDDWALRAAVLANMARQAFWLAEYDDSLTFIELAMVRSDRLTATQRAMLHTARARVLAKLGRVPETIAAIGDADEEFGRTDPAGDPSHIRWYNAAEHAGETGHALSDLALQGHFRGEATARLTAAIADLGDIYQRSRAFCQIRLAVLTMTVGDPREAAAIGIEATETAGAIRSHRVAEGLRELRNAAASHRDITEATELRERIGRVVVT